MYNVLIVDDEQQVRQGLKLKVNWNEIGYQIIGEAMDGREALELLDALPVHVMITDIKMPIMSGLELLKRASAQYPTLKIVVLSGFDDFHYVKAALQSSARDYLLKPFVRSELKTIMAKLHEELELENKRDLQQSEERLILRQTLPAACEKLLLELISDEGEEHLLALRNDIKALQLAHLLDENAGFRILSVDMRLPHGRLEEEAAQFGLLRLAFQLSCRDLAQDKAYSHKVIPFHHPVYPNMMHYLLVTDAAAEEERIVQSLCGEIHSRLRKYLRIETVVAIGDPIRGLAHVRQAYLSALLAWSRSKAGSFSQTVMAERSGDSPDLMPPDMEKRLHNLIEHADLERFMDVIEHAMQAGEVSLRDIQSYMMRIVLLLDQAVTRNGLGMEGKRNVMLPITEWKFNSTQAAVAYLRELSGHVFEEIRRSRSTGGTIVVEGVRHYLDTQYMQEIRLASLAEQFHVNTTYLSELFKKHTGTTFSDYLAQVRIRKAAELLTDPKLRLADIAELTGFANASYLSSVFKKTYGVSPNEYRSQDEEGKNRSFRMP